MDKKVFLLFGFLGVAVVPFAVPQGGARSTAPAQAEAVADFPAILEADWLAQDQLKGGGFRLGHIREVVTRGQKLLADLQTMGTRRELALAADKLKEIDRRLRECETQNQASDEARRTLYLDARRVVREIAFANPLLDFDKLLFVERHPGRFAHMCDQFYGTYARPGGDLVIIEDCWKNPQRKVLVGSQLPTGSFLSPDLSYDGKTILFAYCQVPSPPGRGQGEGKPFETVFRSDADSLKHAKWTADVRYHLYRINVDGTGLKQLTDGEDDDFDPCWLPSGQAAFISTRRGGFCRCGGRPVPTYTLHRLNPADGSDLRRLSHHETNEWHPVVANDGRLIYSRWDYVDRHTNLSHSLWATNTDGTDPTSIYGNYNWDKKPWGEWHPQAIPGSTKLLAIAGAHHGYAFGSLVMIDPAKGTDGQASLTRLTPDIAFPEAEGWPMTACTTPLALSDKYYLVSYSSHWSTRDASHKVTQGIYLFDCFGNRELIYRNPRISALDPIPLKARPRPPVRAEVGETPTGEGEFFLLNAAAGGQYSYSTLYPEGRGQGEGKKIKELRIIQILPKTTFRSEDPRISAARQISARYLLGTVPVEADGSVYFKAPAGVPLYFQTVDADGMAHQTMRTITYVQPGEKRGCVGCHESRHTAAPPSHVPLATLKPPHAIQPGPDGSKPFSYVRLVQPVLDKHCVQCHNPQKAEGKVLLTGNFAKGSPFTDSYKSLTRPDLVHRFNSVSSGEWLPTTTPGQFGAAKSKLIDILRKGHYDVKLDQESLGRLVLWIDMNVPFYGVYEPKHIALQRQGKVVPLEEIVK